MTVQNFKAKFRALDADQKAEVYKNIDKAATSGKCPKTGRRLNEVELRVTKQLQAWTLLNLMTGFN